MINSYHVERLKDELQKRKNTNSSYSLRSFSKFLGIHPSTVSAILNGKRKLPFSRAKSIADLLRLDSNSRDKFLSSVITDKHHLIEKVSSPEEKFTLNDDKYFKVIADWKYYAILNLLELSSTEHKHSFIADRLNIRKEEVKAIISDLLTLGLLEEDQVKGKWLRTTKALKTPEDILSLAIQISHKTDLRHAREKIDSTNVNSRDYSSMTFTLNPTKLPKLKEVIRQFRRQVAQIADDGSETEVYQLGVQLFPLSEKIEPKENN